MPASHEASIVFTQDLLPKEDCRSVTAPGGCVNSRGDRYVQVRVNEVRMGGLSSVMHLRNVSGARCRGDRGMRAACESGMTLETDED